MYCPVVNASGDKALVGCTATGMAMAMKYHNWPIRGNGSHQYTTKTNKLAIGQDFSDTYYDWENMTDEYTESSSLTEKSAVATLMYHCGVAANMDYGLEASGASEYDAALALINHFGYDEGLDVVRKNYYSMIEWSSLLLNELSHLRPVPYVGVSNYIKEGAHFFICDGYDGFGYYHFNWGWGGSCNGFYLLTSMDPNDDYKFNIDESMIIGMQKPRGTAPKPSNRIVLDNVMSIFDRTINRNEDFSITLDDVCNMSIHAFNGLIGVALYTLDNTFVDMLVSTDMKIESLYGISGLRLKGDIPGSIEDGVYKLYPVSMASVDDNWIPIRHRVGLKSNAFYVTITKDKVEFTTVTSEDYVTTFLYDKVYYTISSPNTCVVDGYKNADFNKAPLAIPETAPFNGIDMRVTAIDKGAFYYGYISDVVLPNTITKIEDGAFEYSSLSSIKFGDGLETIGDGAFNNCMSLSGELQFPSSLTEIGNSAFKSCIGLYGQLYIPDSVTRVGDNAFSSTNFSQLVLGSSLKEIGEEAFYFCTDILGSLTIPNSVTKLGVGAFNSCSGLSGLLTISDAIDVIPSGAFSLCSDIDSVFIGRNTRFIGGGAFSYCSGLQTIIVPNKIPPIINANTFSNVHKDKCVLKVDDVGAYKQAAYWSEFKIIVPRIIPDPPVIHVSECVIEMDTIEIGQSSSIYEFIVSGKQLTSDLIITAPNDIFLSPGSTWTHSISLSPTNGDIEPRVISVVFTPTRVGPWQDSIVLSSDNTPSVVIKVQAYGFVKPTASITLSRTSLDFGAIEFGKVSTPLSFTISGNQMTEEVVLTAPDGFLISTIGDYQQSLQLMPIDGVLLTKEINVVFCPSKAGQWEDTLFIQSAEAGRKCLLLRGQGSEPTVHIPVYITTQPTDQQVIEGNSATFTIAVEGTPPFDYRWYNQKGLEVCNSLQTTAKTNSFITPLQTLDGDGAYFYCRVYNSEGEVQSAIVKVTVVTGSPAIDGEAISWRILRNPIDNGMLVLDGLPEEGTASITLHNMQGQLILSCETTTKQCEINMGNVNAGLYILSVRHQQFVERLTLVVKKQ